MRCGCVIARRRRSGSGTVIAVITGLTSNATFGPTPQHNVEVTGVYAGASTWQWQQNTGGGWANISGATSAAFTPVIGTNVTDAAQLRVVPDGDTSLASAAYVIRYAAPTVNAAATATGSAQVGGNATGTAATFNGSGLGSVTSEWEYSTDQVNWTGSGDTDTTSPTFSVLGRYWSYFSQVTNSGGTATSRSNSIGPIADNQSYLLLEDGSFLLLEDNSRVILE